MDDNQNEDSTDLKEIRDSLLLLVQSTEQMEERVARLEERIDDLYKSGQGQSVTEERVRRGASDMAIIRRQLESISGEIRLLERNTDVRITAISAQLNKLMWERGIAIFVFTSIFVGFLTETLHLHFGKML